MFIEVKEVDITRLDVDAIVNAANTDLELGGGVAGAIRRAGGNRIQKECRRKAPIKLGQAVKTHAGDLPCKWVIHTATMHLGGATSAEIVQLCTENSLKLAGELKVGSLALVALGTGVGRLPLDKAAEIMVKAVCEFSSSGPGSLGHVIFAVRGREALNAFQSNIPGRSCLP